MANYLKFALENCGPLSLKSSCGLEKIPFMPAITDLLLVLCSVQILDTENNNLRLLNNPLIAR